MPGRTNPEQLFAVGYAACFEGALAAVARREDLELGEVSIDSRVSLYPTPERGFRGAGGGAPSNASLRQERNLPTVNLPPRRWATRAQGQALPPVHPPLIAQGAVRRPFSWRLRFLYAPDCITRRPSCRTARLLTRIPER